ncbi:phosphate ABC transporter permease subunit PstC [Clostridium sp. NSJ-49]|uniref:phosphate ABC transporter permease subunit PstC n=1 Tax=Clostridium TaxID=1485 RepID=UPI00164CC6CA|nr:MULTISPECIES: phosphate ABC transporter permease subunit PstC [unclassified Clostridium]MBC5623872.1 phosphate ABC transporter permease subunit PstC [Clostridium sp. NSJ-49]MCD2501666.1 phosphate ABC transporter permease subunit PstC [Clostridium sp. NSJ-145]MDU6340542.1 phosphate ABC transporter permease subunit PstC [Clostridium sp.]
MVEGNIKSNTSKYIVDKITRVIFLICALVAVVSLILIIGFVFMKGLKPFVTGDKSFIEFIFGTDWYPTSEVPKYGILPMIIASIYGTVGALIIGVPIGLLTAIFIAEVAPKGVSKFMIPAVELLAGIPSVLYGLFGLAIIVPWIQRTFNLAQGQSLFAVIIVLAVMMLPTIISVSTTAIKAVPKSYKEGSLALGASHIETTFKVVVPAAKSGILAAIVLGSGRAIGETMAIILVAGNSVQIPTSIFDKVRPLTSNIALEMGYASQAHQELLFATGVVLFAFILILNLVISKLSSKEGK